MGPQAGIDSINPVLRTPLGSDGIINGLQGSSALLLTSVPGGGS